MNSSDMCAIKVLCHYVIMIITITLGVESNNEFNLFTQDSTKSKITNWIKLKNKQQHSKELLNSFRMNVYTLGLCP